MSAQMIDGEPVATATPGEVLAAIRVAAERVEGGLPPSATEVAYAVMGVLGVVRVDSRGEPFSIDLREAGSPYGLRRFQPVQPDRAPG